MRTSGLFVFIEAPALPFESIKALQIKMYFGEPGRNRDYLPPPGSPSLALLACELNG
jgi:hypothetical protein